MAWNHHHHGHGCGGHGNGRHNNSGGFGGHGHGHGNWLFGGHGGFGGQGSSRRPDNPFDARHNSAHHRSRSFGGEDHGHGGNSLNGILNDLFGREDTDRQRSSRHNQHQHGAHHDPLYMSGGLGASNNHHDCTGHREGLLRNNHHGGWDFDPYRSDYQIGPQRRDNLTDRVSSLLGDLSIGRDQPSRFKNRGSSRHNPHTVNGLAGGYGGQSLGNQGSGNRRREYQSLFDDFHNMPVADGFSGYRQGWDPYDTGSHRGGHGHIGGFGGFGGFNDRFGGRGGGFW